MNDSNLPVYAWYDDPLHPSEVLDVVKSVPK